mmetsp:Transcript_53884/g.157182  ORF Transcript_53884/g.157182 Transcript_53884/m.157182 type:complete len:351 (-) Transcript_53884:115-1167(-)
MRARRAPPSDRLHQSQAAAPPAGPAAVQGGAGQEVGRARPAQRPAPGERGHGVGVVEHLEAPVPALEVKHQQLALDAAGRQEGALRTDRQAAGGRMRGAQHGPEVPPWQLPPGPDVPGGHAPVVGARSQEVRARVAGQAPDRGGAFHAAQLPRLADVPRAHAAVEARRREDEGEGRAQEAAAGEGGARAAQLPHAPLALLVPEQGPAVLARAGQHAQLPVHVQAGNPRPVAAGRQQAAPLPLGVPELDLAANSQGQMMRSGRQEGGRYEAPVHGILRAIVGGLQRIQVAPVLQVVERDPAVPGGCGKDVLRAHRNTWHGGGVPPRHQQLRVRRAGGRWRGAPGDLLGGRV